MKRIHPIITLLGRTQRICRERISKRKETVYLKGLTEFSRQYGQMRGGTQCVSFENFPQIKNALGNIEISFCVKDYSGPSIFGPRKPIPSRKRLSSLLSRAIRAVIRDLADNGLPQNTKSGAVTDLKLDCKIEIEPKENNKAETSFTIYNL